MDRSSPEYLKCVDILHEELLPATGCTEPISVALCAAICREELGCIPDRVKIEASGNIIKNVKSVFVPHTDHLRGIEAAAAAGIIGGRPERKLDLLSQISPAQQKEIETFLNAVPISLELADTPLIFDVTVTEFAEKASARVRITHYHTNIALIEKNGETVFTSQGWGEGEAALTDRSFLNVSLIWDFANSVAISDVKALLDRQMEYNMAIAQEGLRGDYGANVGSVLLSSHPDIMDHPDSEAAVRLRARAMAAAGSDARMNGCELPVIINSGSGNQGIAVSVPVIVYGRAMGVSEETMYRALVLSNLLSIHQKTSIGRLSAFCGAINAGAAAGCAIAYLHGADLRTVNHTLVNALAISSGVVCDGAKASCAGKIALAVDTGILGYEMFRQGQQFYGGDGIIKKGVENTVASVGRLGRFGMSETDKEILHIMIDA